MQFCHLTGTSHIFSKLFVETTTTQVHTSETFSLNRKKKTITKKAHHHNLLWSFHFLSNQLLPNIDQVLIEHFFCGTKAKGRRRPKARVTAFIQKKKKSCPPFALPPCLCLVTPVSMGCPLWKPGSFSSPLGHGNVSSALLSGGGGWWHSRAGGRD